MKDRGDGAGRMIERSTPLADDRPTDDHPAA